MTGNPTIPEATLIARAKAMENGSSQVRNPACGQDFAGGEQPSAFDACKAFVASFDGRDEEALNSLMHRSVEAEMQVKALKAARAALVREGFR